MQPELERLHVRLQPTLFRDAVLRAQNAFGVPWEAEMITTLAALYPTDARLSNAVKGYEAFCVEIMRLQMDFDRTGEYAPQTYEEASAAVYGNTRYMSDCYLPGLLMAWYLWPHHYRQIQFFRQAFVPQMARASAERFYDVATGTGIYSRIALQGARTAVGVGFDISPASCTFTRNHIGAFGLRERYRSVCSNVMEDTPEPVDWLVCVELAEHLESPMVLLRTLRKMLRPGGRAFIATALNAPNSDHIWLYKSADEVLAQLRTAEFSVEQFQVNAARPGPVPPEVAAFIVT